ncbi:MAG: hypothetical protein KQH59_06700 [Desulfobulbaceae bacterium]|nr:hypothetical protein [Desulfobulbaceae bacterium]
MKVEPIRNVKDIRAIKRLQANSPRNYALFVIGINTNLRASDILSLTVGQVRNLKLGDEVVLKEKKTGNRGNQVTTFSNYFENFVQNT